MRSDAIQDEGDMALKALLSTPPTSELDPALREKARRLTSRHFGAGGSAPSGLLPEGAQVGNYKVERLLTDWFDVPKIIDPGVSIKQFPCCGSTHAAIYAAFELHKSGCLAPADIQSVEVQMHPRRLPHTDTPNPRTPLDAKFSVQYVTARALATGRIGSADFAPGAYDQGEIAALTQRVSARCCTR